MKKRMIGFFGRRNVGKSSLMNHLTGQTVSIVSEKLGTTTDPVKKPIELPGLGPLILVDTAGIDDQEELGLKRVQASLQMLEQMDLAIIVINNGEITSYEKMLLEKVEDFDLPYLIVNNKSDQKKSKEPSHINFSVKKQDSPSILIDKFSNKIAKDLKKDLLGDLVKEGDLVLLVTPVDIQAPEGRLIQAQVQTIRDVLDNNAISIILKEKELDGFLLRYPELKPNLVVTDSQAFLKVAGSLPKDVKLTSFSILHARLKGPFLEYIEGAKKISSLKEGDSILIFESCAHHIQSDDIGRVKIPRWLSEFTGKKLTYDFVAGYDQTPQPIENYKLVIQCGGCMFTERQIKGRLAPFLKKKLSVTNYGLCISYCLGIFDKALEPFGIIKNKDDDKNRSQFSYEL